MYTFLIQRGTIGRYRFMRRRTLTYFEFDVREIVEVGRVVDGLDLDGYGGRPFPDVLPVDAAEERYCRAELVNAPSARSQPPVRLAAEPGYRVAGLLADGHLGREAQRLPPVHHLPVRFLRVLAAERRISCRRTEHNSGLLPRLRQFVYDGAAGRYVVGNGGFVEGRGFYFLYAKHAI